MRDVIEGAMGAVGEEMKGIENRISAKMESLLESCFSKNDKNASRFA